MINMTQPKKEHPTYTKEPVSKIGETGGTVVYIFPGGKACVKKGEKGKKAASSMKVPGMSTAKKRLQKTGPVPTPAANPTHSVDPQASSPFSTQRVQRVGDRLVEAGVINSTQLQVALYDQKAMKLRLGDVLIARGWTDQSTLDSVLSD